MTLQTNKKKQALQEIMHHLSTVDDALPPSEIAGATNQIIRDITGMDDFYAAIKVDSTKKALSFYPYLKSLVAEAPDPIDMALRVSVAGNIIDVIHGYDFDLEEVIQRVRNQPFLGQAIDDFRKDLAQAQYLLLIADNAGETVFDRVLIETLQIPVIYAVKSGPVLNDATVVDAEAVGLDRIAKIVQTGSNSPGTTLHFCSAEFRRMMDDAPLILAKGQANFETLDQMPYGQLYLLLQTKCKIIARHLCLPTRNIVLKHA